jgi:hypothetical protein
MMKLSTHERAELLERFAQQKPTAGIFLVTNTHNGKVLLGSSMNLHGPLNKHSFMLRMGSHWNRELQRDFHAHGAAAFRFEIVETVKPSEKPGFDVHEELLLLEEIWLEKTQPFGERGYNRDARIREF